MYKLAVAHVFHAYNLLHLFFAVFERRLIQHWIDCMQFFFLYNICDFIKTWR